MKFPLIIVAILGLVVCQVQALAMKDPLYAVPTDLTYRSNQQEFRVDNYRKSLRAKVVEAVVSKIKEIIQNISSKFSQLQDILANNGLSSAATLVGDIKDAFNKFADNLENAHIDIREKPRRHLGSPVAVCPPYDSNCLKGIQ